MPSTRSRILSILRQQQTPVSGEALSAALGVSRVAVWKHVRKLQALGYGISAGARGYRLTADLDRPFAWEFPEWESRIHYFDRVSSTMDIARDLARKGCPDFSVVVADQQTRGRGRLQRGWHSPRGGLYFTVVLRPQLSTVLSPRVPLSASLVLALCLHAHCGIDAKLKWPNDILVDGQKICGMLSELEAEGDLVAFINIGIGVNFDNPVPEGLQPATSIRALTGRSLSRRGFLAKYLDALEQRFAKQDFSDIAAQWKTRCVTLGKRVKVETITRVVEGTAKDIDDNGALVLQKADGSLEKIVYGDCFHQKEIQYS